MKADFFFAFEKNLINVSGLAALGTYYYSLGSRFQARAIHVKAEEI